MAESKTNNSQFFVLRSKKVKGEKVWKDISTVLTGYSPVMKFKIGYVRSRTRLNMQYGDSKTWETV